MRKLEFMKLSPGGNTTILITAPEIAEDKRLETAFALMHSQHLQAEQAGFVNFSAAPPRLDMMAGEFCLNASRCLIFAMRGRNLFLPLAGTDDLFGLIACSGMPYPLEARIKNGKPVGAGETALECFISFKAVPQSYRQKVVEPGAVLMRLPGIVHLLLDRAAHRLPEDIFAEAKRWREKLDLDREPCSGVIWHQTLERPTGIPASGDKNIMFHSVVPLLSAGGSAVAETSCGSASLALALLMADSGVADGRKLFMNIMQPSGESLRLRLDGPITKDGGYDVEVGGVVRLIARGETFI